MYIDHFYHRVRRHIKLKKPPKSMDVYNETLKSIQRISQKEPRRMYVTKEEIAFELGIRVHYVEQALQKLNLAGVVGQPVHMTPHDCNRGTRLISYGNDSSWCSDVYYLREKSEDN